MKKRVCLSILISLIIALAIMPLTSALFDYGLPSEILNNEWTKFGIILVLLFASIYSFLNKRMQNPPVSIIIALGLSALISIPIMQRGLIDPFLSPDIVDWTVIIAFGVMFIFFFYKFGMRTDDYGRKRFSIWGLVIFLGILIFVLYLISDYLPDNVTYGPVGDTLDWIKSLSWILIVIVVILIAIGIFWGRHREKRGYKWSGYYKARGEDRAKRGWFGFGRGKKQSTPYYQSQEANVP